MKDRKASDPIVIVFMIVFVVIGFAVAILLFEGDDCGECSEVRKTQSQSLDEYRTEVDGFAGYVIMRWYVTTGSWEIEYMEQTPDGWFIRVESYDSLSELEADIDNITNMSSDQKDGFRLIVDCIQAECK